MSMCIILLFVDIAGWIQLTNWNWKNRKKNYRKKTHFKFIISNDYKTVWFEWTTIRLMWNVKMEILLTSVCFDN